MANPRLIDSIETVQSLVGEDLGVSDWLTITQERIDMFGEATNDKQWIHCDPVRAKAESPYGGTIAHGHLTMSLAPSMLQQIVDFRANMLVNPGVERVRLRTPVRCGDRIRMHAALKAIRMLPDDGVRATIAIKFEIEGQKRPAAFGDVLLVYFL
jgi:acyl dehydratase